MTTRRRLIQSIPALPLMTTAGAAALLAAVWASDCALVALASTADSCSGDTVEQALARPSTAHTADSLRRPIISLLIVVFLLTQGG